MWAQLCLYNLSQAEMSSLSKQGSLFKRKRHFISNLVQPRLAHVTSVQDENLWRFRHNVLCAYTPLSFQQFLDFSDLFFKRETLF